MAVIIGKTAYQVTAVEALDHVAGYSIFNDGTIRDYQKRTHQWTVGKNFDQSGGFGPEMVTADELPAGGKGLQIRTLLNGEIMQEATTADMIFDVAEVIHLMSQCFTLEPGDVIVSGTPEGVGYVRKPPIYMRQGDEVIVEIEGIGKLVNRISD
jgi:2-keto-4-pentenoate hydratase/2-oxohepta-3-ene-1,7-dioic acid hydratase in catechol pathway